MEADGIFDIITLPLSSLGIVFRLFGISERVRRGILSYSAAVSSPSSNPKYNLSSSSFHSPLCFSSFLLISSFILSCTLLSIVITERSLWELSIRLCLIHFSINLLSFFISSLILPTIDRVWSISEGFFP